MEHNAEYCKNCDQHLLLNQKYCHNCGQETNTHRINFHFLIHEIQHSIFHVDGGIFYTLKELFIRPGFMIRDYLEGKRIRHFKPVLLLIILGTISSLSYILNPREKNNKEIINIVGQNEIDFIDLKALSQYLKTIADWFSEHVAFSILFLIPAIAFGFYLGFKKYEINYPEWLVSITYLASFAMAVDFLFMIIESIFHYDISFIFSLIIFGFILWAMLQFFSGKSIKSIILRTIWSEFLVFIFVILFIVIVALGVILTGFMKYSHLN
ncbi:DUF3667 domain-containing protein [Halpernia sp.]|uniref:DUF3667 domain-containing protein n=1 Tax=Halpernia sp. TaxID=2782209 RepID=UPI003A93FA1D